MGLIKKLFKLKINEKKPVLGMYIRTQEQLEEEFKEQPKEKWEAKYFSGISLKDRVLNIKYERLQKIIQSEREQAIKERDGYWKDIIMKKLYNMDTCNDVNEIFNLMDKLKK
jgi:hypothetical protein